MEFLLCDPQDFPQRQLYFAIEDPLLQDLSQVSHPLYLRAQLEARQLCSFMQASQVSVIHSRRTLGFIQVQGSNSSALFSLFVFIACGLHETNLFFNRVVLPGNLLDLPLQAVCLLFSQPYPGQALQH